MRTIERRRFEGGPLDGMLRDCYSDEELVEAPIQSEPEGYYQGTVALEDVVRFTVAQYRLEPYHCPGRPWELVFRYKGKRDLTP